MDIEKKKVLLTITQLEFGGAQKAIFELASGLKRNGWDASVAIV